MAVELTFLKSIPYFARLSHDELNLVKKLVFEKKVERGDIIVLEGEPAEALYFVGSGAVKMFRTSVDGKEQVLNIVRPGESFNDVAIFGGGPNLANAQAMGPVIVYGILKRGFLTRSPADSSQCRQYISNSNSSSRIAGRGPFLQARCG